MSDLQMHRIPAGLEYKRIFGIDGLTETFLGLALMTTITLPADLEAPLREEARKQGTTTEAVALDSLRKLFGSSVTKEEPSNEGSLFDFLKGYSGMVNGTSEPLSERCGERFADGLVEKQQRGRL